MNELHDKLIERYGDALPSPIHEPIRYAYYVRLYNYVKDKIQQLR